MHPQCYSYIRFSSKEQRKGDSLRRQTDYAEKYAKENGLILDDSLKIEDFGLSAFHGDHRSKGALGLFLEKVENGEIPPGSHLVIEALDRLTRQDITEAINLLTGLVLKDIIICTAADGMVYRKDQFEINQLMYSAMKMATAHEESLKKQQRSLKTWENKRTNAKSKKITSLGPAWLKLSKNRKMFRIIPERAEVIKRIFEMKLNGVGIERMARLLNQSDCWKPQGRLSSKLPGWDKSYIDKILRSKSVIGEFQSYSSVDGTRQPMGDPIIDYFPRVIKDETFYAVQEQLAVNKGKGGKNGKFRNLFGNIAKCGYCGSTMQLVVKGRESVQGKYFLECHMARRGIGCFHYLVRYKAFEELLLRYCKGLEHNKILPDSAEANSKISNLQNSLAGVRGELLDIEKRIENLANAIEENPDKNARDLLNTRLIGLMRQCEKRKNDEQQIEGEINKLISCNSETEKQINNIKELISGLADAPPEIRASLRNRLRSLIDKIVIYPVGKPRMTPELVDKNIDAMLDVIPDMSKDEQEQHRAKLSAQIGNKEFANCDIFFRSGSIRHLNLGRYPEMPLEINREENVVINRFINQDGVEENWVIKAS